MCNHLILYFNKGGRITDLGLSIPLLHPSGRPIFGLAKIGRPFDLIFLSFPIKS
jgi:hypothetical protein